MKKNNIKNKNKILVLMVITAMTLVSLPGVMAEWDSCVDEPQITTIGTHTNVLGCGPGGGSGGGSGNNPCIVSLPPDPVTMNTYYSYDNSFFKTTLSNVPSGYDIWNGLYDGWCVQYGTYIPINEDFLVDLYSSYCPPAHLVDDDWNKVNYILNHKLSNWWEDIQTAIWHFVNFGPNTYTPTTLGQQMIDEGCRPSQAWVHFFYSRSRRRLFPNVFFTPRL